MRLIGLAVVLALSLALAALAAEAQPAGGKVYRIGFLQAAPNTPALNYTETFRQGGTALFAWPLVAHAQQQAKIARLGYLGFGAPAASANRVEALRAGLRDLGYIEGRNLVIEFRWSGTVEQMHEAAAELVRMKVDVIFATSSTESEPARRATNTIPIVFATHADPVGVGHVSSLARPGGELSRSLLNLARRQLASPLPRVERELDLHRATQVSPAIRCPGFDACRRTGRLLRALAGLRGTAAGPSFDVVPQRQKRSDSSATEKR
jgi:hypothetical protein